MKLIDDWKRAKHFYSVHFSVYGVIFNGIFAAIVKGTGIAVTLIGVLPLRYVFLAGAVLSLMAGLSRLVCQKPVKPIDPGMNP